MPTKRLPLFTASSAERVIACPASAALPHVLTTSAAADRGSVIHDFLRCILENMHPAIALLRVPEEHRSTCANINVHKATGDLGRVRAEVAYALNVRSREVRELGVNIGRAYDVEPFEIAGTIDVVGVDMTDGPVVVDWKTGQNVTPCRANMQMQFASVCAAKMHESEEVEARVAYVREDGFVHVDRHTFGFFDLESYVDRIAEAHDQVTLAKGLVEAGRVPDVSPGEWCTYCPALSSCPAHVALARSMATELAEVAATIAQLAPVDAGVAWQRLKAIKALVDKVDEGLRAYARATPIPIGETKELRAVPSTRTSANAGKLAELARSKGATDEEIASCNVTTESVSVREVKRT